MHHQAPWTSCLGATSLGREDPGESRPSLSSQNLAATREVRSLEQAAAELQGQMQEKATLVARDACNLSLLSVQTLQQQHRCLEVRVNPGACPPDLFPCIGGPRVGKGRGGLLAQVRELSLRKQSLTPQDGCFLKRSGHQVVGG